MVQLGDGPWTDSGIDVAEGERLILKTEGTFGFANSISGGPEGVADFPVENLPLPDARFGAVIGRIGDALFVVGAGIERKVDTGGRLQLGANIPPDWSKRFPIRFQVAVTVVPPPVDDTGDGEQGNELTVDADGSGDNIAAPLETPSPAAKPGAKARPARTASRLETATADEPAFPWAPILAALAAAALLTPAVVKWRRARLSARTQARLVVSHSLSADAPQGGWPPPELAAAWPTVATRWRVEEKEPAFGGWAGEEVSHG
jgi:hypothetical protein